MLIYFQFEPFCYYEVKWKTVFVNSVDSNSIYNIINIDNVFIISSRCFENVEDIKI